MTDPLPFTGERFTPECVREIWYEHWHRYAFALRFAAGRRVLDAACGEGYGSALLARRATSVLGVDVAESAVAHALSRYAGMPGLRFERADATVLDHLPDASFDLVVSFETLEHLEAQDRLLAGFARLLTPDGLLIVSSPDKRTYTDLSGVRNEHHVRELYRDEFEALLTRHFAAHRLFGQKLLFQSAIWDLGAAPATAEAATATLDAGTLTPTLDYAPLYFIAIAAKRADALPVDLAGRVALFGDREESVYAHYNHEVRKNIAAGTLLAELQQRLAAAEARIAATAEPTPPAPAAVEIPASGRAGPWSRVRRWLGR